MIIAYPTNVMMAKKSATLIWEKYTTQHVTWSIAHYRPCKLRTNHTPDTENDYLE